MPTTKATAEQTQPDFDSMEQKSIARTDYDFLNSYCPHCRSNSIIVHTREVRVPKRILRTAEVAQYFNDGVFADGNKLFLPDQLICTDCSTITTFTGEK